MMQSDSQATSVLEEFATAAASRAYTMGLPISAFVYPLGTFGNGPTGRGDSLPP
jgi:hypothetical protein